jgi:hypothetical protein
LEEGQEEKRNRERKEREWRGGEGGKETDNACVSMVYERENKWRRRKRERQK